MNKITIHDYNMHKNCDYTVDLDRQFEGYEKGDLICHVCPFLKIPLMLEIAIRADGNLIFRYWEWSFKGINSYLHTDEKPDKFTPTKAQIDTVNGLFSGRITFDGLKLAVGATVQDICPIDLTTEEKRCNKKIYCY